MNVTDGAARDRNRGIFEGRSWPAMPPPEAWSALCERLQAASDKMQRASDTPDANAAFGATSDAFFAALGYLASSPEMAALLAPLRKLGEAMCDLERGARPALLAPKPATHRPPGETPKAHVIGFAARALDRLMQSGESSEHAARKVAQAMRKGRAIGYESVTVVKIKSWRNRCREGIGTTDIAPFAVEKFHQKLPDLDKPPAEEARILLEILELAHEVGLGE